MEEAVYGMVSEAVTNVVRHAGASRAIVEVGVDSGRLVAAVRDDGSGFRADSTPGVGLVSMRERARALGGSLLVDSTATGTTVTFDVPVAVPAEATVSAR